MWGCCGRRCNVCIETGKRCSCVSTHPSRNEGAGLQDTATLSIFYFTKAGFIYVSLPGQSNSLQLPLLTANSILYTDSSRFCESLAKVFKDTFFFFSVTRNVHTQAPPTPGTQLSRTAENTDLKWRNYQFLQNKTKRSGIVKGEKQFLSFSTERFIHLVSGTGRLDRLSESFARSSVALKGTEPLT